MPTDINVDQLGNPTWNCFSVKSYTTINRYGQYQAESFRHSLKEETEKLRQTSSSVSSLSASTSNNSNCVVPDVENGQSKRRKLDEGLSGLGVGLTNVANAASASTGANGLPTYSKMIKFGTNVDLSDEKKFSAQLRVSLLLQYPYISNFRSSTKCPPFVEFRPDVIC